MSGDIPEGELGFRFGEPLDVDGDGRADIAAGARFKLHGIEQSGVAAVWSGASGAKLRSWDGEFGGGLFGHWVLPVPDIDGDGLADLIISAPNAAIEGTVRGVVVARSPRSAAEIWKRVGERNENFGWDLAPVGDQNGDGSGDILAGAPAADSGQAYLLSGRDAKLLHTYAPQTAEPSFGWYVAGLGDLDGDGRGELAIGAPGESNSHGVHAGGVYVFSSTTAKVLLHLQSDDDRSRFGEIVAGIADVDGDGRADLAVGVPRTGDTGPRPGEVRLYSGATGREIRHWSGTRPGELFGRMVVSAGDLDGDGVEDLAMSAPWHERETESRVGRVEFRSGRTGALLSELFGETADSWFGWHIRRAPDPDGLGRPALLISSLRHPVDGRSGVGVLDLYVLRKSEPAVP